MPNRIIKDTILTSETVGGLDDFAFRLFVSLICLADDYGRGKAHPAIVRGQAFPLRDVSVKDVEQAMKRLAEAGAIQLYKVGDSHYYCFPTWAKHQRTRNSVERFPAPPADNSPQLAATCGESRRTAANGGDLRPNPIQSNTIQSNTMGIQRPTLDEVKAECREKKYATDPARFFNYYESVGWKIKGERIQNWRAMLAVWASGDKKQGINDPDHFDDLREWAELANKRERR